MTRYRLVAEHRAQWGVEEMCRVLKVSRSGYYDWQQRPPSPRAEQTQRLDTTIKCRWLNDQAAYRSLFEYIEIFYNRERSHSTLYYVSPDQFEQNISTIAA